MADVYRNTRDNKIAEHDNSDYTKGWKDCENAIMLEVRNHLTPLLNAVDALEAILNNAPGHDELIKVMLKASTIDMMHDEIKNLADLRI